MTVSFYLINRISTARILLFSIILVSLNCLQTTGQPLKPTTLTVAQQMKTQVAIKTIPGVRQIAGVIIIVTDPSPHVLMVSSQSKRNEWILPKGGVEMKDAINPVLGDPYLTGGLRETQEESGVSPVHLEHQYLHSLGTINRTPLDKPERPELFHWFTYPIVSLGADVVPGIKELHGDEWLEGKERVRAWVPIRRAVTLLKKEHMIEALSLAISALKLDLNKVYEPVLSLPGSTIPILPESKPKGKKADA